MSSNDESTPTPELTAGELAVMKALWDGGRSSAREVHDRLAEDSGWAYTTTRTMLDRMAKKGLVERHTFHGLLLFRPLLSRPHGLATLVRRFAESVLEVPAARVVSLFGESEALTDDERRELERLISEQEGREAGDE